MKPIQAGKYRHRAQFQTPSGSPDAAGQPSQTWATYYTAWARVEPLRGQLLYQTAEFIAKSTYKVALRYPAAGVTIGEKDRVVCNGMTFVIETVLNIEQRNRQLELLCHVVNEEN